MISGMSRHRSLPQFPQQLNEDDTHAKVALLDLMFVKRFEKALEKSKEL